MNRKDRRRAAAQQKPPLPEAPANTITLYSYAGIDELILTNEGPLFGIEIATRSGTGDTNSVGIVSGVETQQAFSAEEVVKLAHWLAALLPRWAAGLDDTGNDEEADADRDYDTTHPRRISAQ